MNKKILLLMAILVAVPILIYVAGPKYDERESITIISHNSYVKMSIDDLIAESDLIVIGNLNTIHASRWNTPNGKRPEGAPAQKITADKIIFTDMDIKISKLIKGETQQGIVRIRSLGGVVDGDRMNANAVVPEKNKTYLLFLYLDTRGSTASIVPGHYWITGGPQGLYEIMDGRAISLSNEWFLEDLVNYIREALSAEIASPTSTPFPTPPLTETPWSPTASPEPSELPTETLFPVTASPEPTQSPTETPIATSEMSSPTP